MPFFIVIYYYIKVTKKKKKKKKKKKNRDKDNLIEYFININKINWYNIQ